jgi:hypothetical protein
MTMQFYPNIVLISDAETGWDEIINRGPGPALDVCLATGEGGGDWDIICETWPPGIALPAPENVVSVKARDWVYMTWRDYIGNSYFCEWRYDEESTKWLPDILSEEGLELWRREHGLPARPESPFAGLS